MTWRRPGDKPLSEPMVSRLPTHICVTRPQWVKDTRIQGPSRMKTKNRPRKRDLKSLSWSSTGICSPMDNEFHYSDVIMSAMASHQPHDCLLNRLFRAQIKENIKAVNKQLHPFWNVGQNHLFITKLGGGKTYLVRGPKDGLGRRGVGISTFQQ